MELILTPEHQKERKKGETVQLNILMSAKLDDIHC